MRDAQHRQDHHPARLIRAILVALAALGVAAPANAGRFAALPSPAAALSPAPPLGNGATASAENIRHRIAATTRVDVGIDGRGAPFRIVATQRLDVRDTGDYFFTIGAPVTAVTPAHGSASSPGFRTGSIVWAGFNPSRRLLAARAVLEAPQAAPSLPLRVAASGGRTILTNVTGVNAQTFAADATRGPLLRYLSSLRQAVQRDRLPVGGSAIVLSTPTPVRLHVVAPLRVRGTIGGRAVSLVLRGRTVVPATGDVRLTVTPLSLVDTGDVTGLGGRALLAYTMRAILTVARVRQYDAFLGNPDPTGASHTTYVYRTARRPTAQIVHTFHGRTHSWTRTVAVALAGILALAAGVVVWARS